MQLRPENGRTGFEVSPDHLSEMMVYGWYGIIALTILAVSKEKKNGKTARTEIITLFVLQKYKDICLAWFRLGVMSKPKMRRFWASC